MNKTNKIYWPIYFVALLIGTCIPSIAFAAPTETVTADLSDNESPTQNEIAQGAKDGDKSQFVDKNGDGINDGKERRFRRRFKRNKAKQNRQLNNRNQKNKTQQNNSQHR